MFRELGFVKEKTKPVKNVNSLSQRTVVFSTIIMIALSYTFRFRTYTLHQILQEASMFMYDLENKDDDVINYITFCSLCLFSVGGLLFMWIE